MANNQILYNAVVQGLCGGASRCSLDVTGATYATINAVAARVALLVDAEIAPIVGGANTSQADLLAEIVSGVYRNCWPTDSAVDFTEQVDAIVEQFVSQAALLGPISGGGGVTLRNTFPYTTYVDPNSTSTGIPDGSFANPFLTLEAAIAALDSTAIVLSEYPIFLAPGYYLNTSIIPVTEPNRSYRLIGSSVASTSCVDWIIVGGTGTLTFERCEIVSSGTWNQSGYSLVFIDCVVNLSAVTLLAPPADGVIRFIDCSGYLAGVTFANEFSILELDGRSRYAVTVDYTTFLGSPFQRGGAVDTNRVPGEFWVGDLTVSLPGRFMYPAPTDSFAGSLAQPFRNLDDCLNAIAAANLVSATIHLAPRQGAVVYTSATVQTFTTSLCIIGEAFVSNCLLDSLNCANADVEIRNCHVVTDPLIPTTVIANTLNFQNCAVDADITVNTSLELTLCKSEAVSGSRTWTALTAGSSYYVDNYTDYMLSQATLPTLVQLAKVVRG